MKFLAFVDFHQDPDDFEVLKNRVKKHDPDFVVCAGDFTWFGEKTKEILESFLVFNRPVYIIHGNHEDEDDVKEYCEEHELLIYVHEKVIRINDAMFVFYGGGGFAEKEPHFSKLIKKHKEELEKHNKIILVTHAPPKDTILDKLSDDCHVGIIDFKKFIDEYGPVLVISGHIHEAYKQQDTYKKTFLINPGGDGEIIEI